MNSTSLEKGLGSEKWRPDLFISLLFVFYLFSVKFTFLPIDTSRVYYILIPAVVFSKIKNAKTISLSVFLGFLLVASLAVVSSIIEGGTDLIFLRVCIEYTLKMLCSLSLAYMICSFVSWDFRRIIRIIYFVFFIQSIFFIITVLSPEIQRFWLKFVDVPYGYDFDSNWRFRQLGLTGWAVYDLSVTMLLPLFMLPMALNSFRGSMKFCIKLITLLTVIVAIFSARSAFIGLTIYVVFVVAYYLANFNNVISRELIKDIGKSMAVVSVVVAAIIFVFQDYLVSFEWMINRTFEIFINLFQGQGVSSQSTDILQEMYVVPDYIDILAGDGIYTLPDGSYYGATDVGYLRILYYFGVVGSLLFYIAWGLFFLKFVFHFRSEKFRVFSMSILSYFFFIFIIQAKGNIFFDLIHCFGVLFFIYFSSKACKYVKKRQIISCI